MAKSMNLVLAGFGGQGILFAGKVTAYSGLMEDAEISWLPSYGPEMRGGTANCSVCISDAPIGSPLVVTPDTLIVMNLPSLDKFIDTVVPGGTVIVDSSMIDKKVERTDVNVYYVPATELAEANGLKGLANMVLIGKMQAVTGFCADESLDAGLQKCVSAKRIELLDKNRQAIKLGKEA